MPAKGGKKPRGRTGTRSARATEILDVRLAAELLTVSPDTVYELFKNGDLSGRKVGRKWITTTWRASCPRCLETRSPLPEKSLPHLGDNRKFRIHDVRNLKLHCLAQQQAGAALIESVVGHQPPHQFCCRVLHRFVDRTGTAQDHNEVGIFQARPVDALLLDEVD